MHLDWTGNVDCPVGTWRLSALIRSDGVRGDYRAQDGERQAWIALVRADAEEGCATWASWQEASNLRHENLVRILDLGKVELGAGRYFYAVLEPPDDSVGEILSGRVLDVEEGRALVSTLGRTLAFLHARSLRLGDAGPANLFIFGEGLKLGVDRICALGEDGAGADLRQLGETLVRAMTGSASASGARSLPSPFREVATGCGGAPGNGWTAETVLRVLEGGPARAGTGETAPGRRLPVTAIAAAMGAAILGLLWWSHPLGGPPAKPEPVAAVPSPGPAVVETPAAVAARREGKDSWAVVAATYATFRGAQGRAKAIAQRSPKLQPRVIPPEGHGNRYFVILGSGMTQREAEKLRDTARQLGAPRDTYVTKLDAS